MSLSTVYAWFSIYKKVYLEVSSPIANPVCLVSKIKYSMSVIELVKVLFVYSQLPACDIVDLDITVTRNLVLTAK